MKTALKTGLAAELKQSRPFSTSQQEAYLSVIRTASDLSRSLDRFLKPFGVTQPQYNVLRILQGAEPQGLFRNEISERMVASTPDMSRLLARMEKSGWVLRGRSDEDKRQVSTRITPAGIELLASVHRPIAQLHQEQFRCLTEAKLKSSLALLTEIRRK